MCDQGCQTLYSKYELSAKVENMILKNETYTTKLQSPEIVSTLSYENVSRDPGLMKHFSGLSTPRFELLHNFLDDVCPFYTIHYWTSKDFPATENAGTGPKSEFSSREKTIYLPSETEERIHSQNSCSSSQYPREEN